MGAASSGADPGSRGWAGPEDGRYLWGAVGRQTRKWAGLDVGELWT